jgi:hemerythrin
VSIKELDEQHRVLFGLINQLYEAMEERNLQDDPSYASAIQELATIAAAIDEMSDYISYHFTCEEEYLLENEYPEYDQQKTAHKIFVDRVARFQSDFDAGNALTAKEIADFINVWLVDHISVSDKKYGPFLNEKGLT